MIPCVAQPCGSQVSPQCMALHGPALLLSVFIYHLFLISLFFIIADGVLFLNLVLSRLYSTIHKALAEGLESNRENSPGFSAVGFIFCSAAHLLHCCSP